MKTTTVLLLIAATGLTAGCKSHEDHYTYSDTAYRANDRYYPNDRYYTTTTTPSTTTTTTTTTSRTFETTAPRETGTTVWHSTRDTGMYRDGGTYQKDTGATYQQGVLAAQDLSFAKEAAQGGQREVEMGRLAVRQASNDRVRQLGQKLIDDHTKANDELATLARQKNVDISTQRTGAERGTFERLAQLQGAEFDRQFIDMVIQDHQRDIELFDRQARTGEDPQFKAFAARTLPVLRSHLQMAKDIQTSLEATDLGVPRRTPSGTQRNPNQPIQPSEPYNPNRPMNPNNPQPMNPYSEPSTPR